MRRSSVTAKSEEVDSISGWDISHVNAYEQPLIPMDLEAVAGSSYVRPPHRDPAVGQTREIAPGPLAESGPGHRLSIRRRRLQPLAVCVSSFALPQPKPASAYDD